MDCKPLFPFPKILKSICLVGVCLSLNKLYIILHDKFGKDSLRGEAVVPKLAKKSIISTLEGHCELADTSFISATAW